MFFLEIAGVLASRRQNGIKRALKEHKFKKTECSPVFFLHRFKIKYKQHAKIVEVFNLLIYIQKKIGIMSKYLV
jgi:hypothetical protein